MAATTYTVNLRPKNQMTLPREIVEQLDLRPGDRLIVEVDQDDPHRLHVRPVRRSYAGIYSDLFASAEEAAEYVRSERAAWEQ